MCACASASMCSCVCLCACVLVCMCACVTVCMYLPVFVCAQCYALPDAWTKSISSTTSPSSPRHPSTAAQASQNASTPRAHHCQIALGAVVGHGSLLSLHLRRGSAHASVPGGSPQPLHRPRHPPPLRLHGLCFRYAHDLNQAFVCLPHACLCTHAHTQTRLCSHAHTHVSEDASAHERQTAHVYLCVLLCSNTGFHVRVASVIRVPSMTEASASPPAVRLSQRRSLPLPTAPPANGI